MPTTIRGRLPAGASIRRVVWGAFDELVFTIEGGNGYADIVLRRLGGRQQLRIRVSDLWDYLRHNKKPENIPRRSRRDLPGQKTLYPLAASVMDAATVGKLADTVKGGK